MMKKLFCCIVLFLSCFIMSACGGPSVKEEAQRLDTEYYQALKQHNQSMTSEMDKLKAQYNGSGEYDIQIAAIVETKYKPEFDKLKDKFSKEKVNEDTKELHEIINSQFTEYETFLNSIIALKDKSKLNYQNFMSDVNNNLINMTNNKLKYQNTLSLLTNNKSTYELTLSNYQKIHKGDSYSTVANTFKMPGELTNSSESNTILIGQRKLDHYVWKNGDAYVRIMFENGKVYMMEQKGLK